MSNTSHPQRYPIHSDPLKGQIHGGECNRTRCDRRGAVWWNMGTYGFYCTHDATAINRGAIGYSPPLCVRVTEKPAVADMEKFRRDNGYYK